MKTIDAAYNVVHDYPGGALALAPRLGKHVSSLNNEVNPPAKPTPGAPTPKFGIVDAIKITHLTGDVRIVAAFNEECGFCPPLRLADVGACEGTVTELLQRGAELSREVANAFAEFQDDLSDGKVTPTELAAFEARALETIGAIAALAQSMRSKMEVDQRSHVANATALGAKKGA